MRNCARIMKRPATSAILIDIEPRLAVGYLARRLPRGRGHIGQWLNEHPGSKELPFRDITGHSRIADLREDLEARWFAGERAVGLPPEVRAKVASGDVVV